MNSKCLNAGLRQKSLNAQSEALKEVQGGAKDLKGKLSSRAEPVEVINKR